MSYPYFSHNGVVLAAEQAVVPLSSIEYAYGFGVYETIRIAHGYIYFLEQHVRRLMKSAEMISLTHNFSTAFIQSAVQQLIDKNAAETCNLKILLVGGPTAETANLYLMCLNPLFPDRKLYSQGAKTTTYNYERLFPGAKTLNMLPSYLAYRQARETGAYDALLINRQDCITEGTRTNFWALRGHVIISPPASEILPGVMRDAVISVAKNNGFEVKEDEIKLEDIKNYDGTFLSSTSSKIMPIRSINDFSWETMTPALSELMSALNHYLDALPKNMKAS